ACPTRALTMTNEYELADDNRESLIWTKEQLVAPLLPGMEAPPHPMRLGPTEKDYYLLGATHVAGAATAEEPTTWDPEVAKSSSATPAAAATPGGTERRAAASGAASAAESTAFWVLAVLAVAAALGMILARRAVHCAVLLAVVMLSLAVLYALQGAPFLAFVQVIVYTGAVLMLFLFVLMIVGVSSADSLVETIKGQRMAAGLAGIGLLVLLSLVVGHAALASGGAASASYGPSNMNGLATLIFTRYVFPFEATSALLITAALGAMVLAHRERTSPKPTQRSMSKLRMAGS